MSSQSDQGKITDTNSQSSTNTLRQKRIPISPWNSTHIMLSGDLDTGKTFGLAVQKFAQKVTATLTCYKISENVLDTNFNNWSPVIFELLQTLGYEKYLVDPIYQYNSISESKQACFNNHMGSQPSRCQKMPDTQKIIFQPTLLEPPPLTTILTVCGSFSKSLTVQSQSHVWI